MKFASIGLFFAAFLIGQLYAADKANKANKDYHQALSKPISRAASGGCMDVYSQCPQWAKQGACDSKRYTKDAKRALCGVSCKLCKKSSPSSNSNSKGSGDMDEKLSKTLEALGKPLGELVNNLNDIVKVAKAKLAELAKQNGEPDDS